MIWIITVFVVFLITNVEQPGEVSHQEIIEELEKQNNWEPK